MYREKLFIKIILKAEFSMQAKNVALVMFNNHSNNDIPLQHLKSSHRHKVMLHRGDEKKMTVRSLLAKEELGL